MEQYSASAPTIGDVRDTIAALIGSPTASISGDANLVYLGLGSLEMMRLATRWRRQGLTVDFAELVATPTLNAWYSTLSAAWMARYGNAQEAVA